MAARTRDRDLPEAPPRYDAYFGMLVISFIATLVALVFLYLDYSTYPPGKLPPVTKATTSAGAAAAPGP